MRTTRINKLIRAHNNDKKNLTKLPLKTKYTKRAILPDPIHDTIEIAKCVNMLMWDGKKNLAQKIVYSAFELIEKQTKLAAIDVFKTALENIKPQVELKVKRVAGSNIQQPTKVRPERQITLALRWLINYARARNEKTMIERLAKEIIDAANNTGGAIKKKEDTKKMADANQAYANMH